MDKGKQITGTARAELAREMKEQYENGLSIRAIAEAHGILLVMGPDWLRLTRLLMAARLLRSCEVSTPHEGPTRPNRSTGSSPASTT